MTNNISLYFHIPFCIKKCDYCAFYSLPAQEERLKQAYFDALCRQIEFFETEKRVATVYFGGGTPPLLGIKRLCKLISLVRSRFILDEDCEITVEVNPGTVDSASLRALREAGANRLSIGIQAASNDVLRLIGRIHSFEDAKRCISEARSAGFENISADVIFALPYQDSDAFTKGLNMIMSTNVDHVSAYSLQLEEGTPLYSRRDTLEFPDEDDEESQYNSLCTLLTSSGFTHYEISSFAKEGFESRHNLNYWACGEYFGFGAGAHSYYMGKRFSAPPDIEMYIEKSFVSLLAPTDYGECEPITPDEANEERIMLGLRTRYGVKLPEEKRIFGIKVSAMGYGSFENGVLRLNSRGFRVSNKIIADILA